MWPARGSGRHYRRLMHHRYNAVLKRFSAASRAARVVRPLRLLDGTALCLVGEERGASSATPARLPVFVAYRLLDLQALPLFLHLRAP